MSAVSNLTSVYLSDTDTSTAPHESSFCMQYANYDEAMSYCKWLSLNLNSTIYLFIWNYNGGSGFWNGGVFTPRTNQNWP